MSTAIGRLFRRLSRRDSVQTVAREWRVIRVPRTAGELPRTTTAEESALYATAAAGPPRPLPPDASELVPGQVQRGSPADAPVFRTLTIGGWIGSHVKFTLIGERAGYLAIWGPNPAQIGPPWGRMRMPPVGKADVLIGTCEGNFTPGTYYVEVAVSGTVGPIGPLGNYSVLAATSLWKWW